MKVTLRNNTTGMEKTVKLGFCWTSLFFSVFVPVVRGDWKNFFIQLIIDIASFGVGCFVFPFIYNKTYIKGLIDKGFLPKTETDKTMLNMKNIMAAKTAKRKRIPSDDTFAQYVQQKEKHINSDN